MTLASRNAAGSHPGTAVSAALAAPTNAVNTTAPTTAALAMRYILINPPSHNLGTQHHDAVADRAATVGIEQFEKDELAVITAFASLYLKSQFVGHEDHRAETTREARDALRIARCLAFDDPRDAHRQGRHAHQQRSAQPGAIGRRRVGMKTHLVVGTRACCIDD